MPRVAEGAALAAVASAMMDVSDGLHDDAGKLMRASGCGADLDAGRLPLSPQLLARAGLRAAREMALTGGDDYELLFTVPARLEPRLARLTRGWSVPVTRLGTVRPGAGLRWQLDGAPFRFRDRTFRHFRGARR
jgi:thiamine-monophosphate kinase